jgi:hypothetical protein
VINHAEAEGPDRRWPIDADHEEETEDGPDADNLVWQQESLPARLKCAGSLCTLAVECNVTGVVTLSDRGCGVEGPSWAPWARGIKRNVL